MKRLLDQLGDDVTYSPETGSDVVIKAIFNEFVGFVDDQARAIFTVSTLASNGVASPQEGDRITIVGESVYWTVVDVRDSKDDTAELRCDRSKLIN